MGYKWDIDPEGGVSLFEDADQARRFVGSYGDAPEDQTHTRDWKWVEPELNRVASERDTLRAALDETRAALRSLVDAMPRCSVGSGYDMVRAEPGDTPCPNPATRGYISHEPYLCEEHKDRGHSFRECDYADELAAAAKLLKGCM